MPHAAELTRTLPPAPRHAPTLRRHVPLRSVGLLVILAIVAMTIGLVGSALLFRGFVLEHLEAIDISLKLGLYAHPDLATQLAHVRDYIDGGTVMLICTAWLGITVVGALALLFFWKLAADIGAVRARALAIVSGDRSRGEPLERQDELGDLGQAVDDLAVALGKRERDLEIERRHVMHQDKLATIGSMAAGVLREIGNPIAAIEGYAQAMVDAQPEGDGAAVADATGSWYGAGQILQETRRLVNITREIACLAAAPATQRELVSLNEVVARSSALLRYEPRLEGVALTTRLDPQLPATLAIGDRLVLLLTNLVINAADATAALPPHTARVEVATRHVAGAVELTVVDNGSGMTDAVRERAFEPLFTTKPAGVGTGLGLPLARAIVEEHGGRITLESTPGAGTRVGVWLPLQE